MTRKSMREKFEEATGVPKLDDLLSGKARQQIEERVGLPPLEDLKSLSSGQAGKRLDSILARLERLSKEDPEKLREAKEFLNLAAELHREGVITDLNQSLDKVIWLMRSKRAQTVFDQVWGRLEEIFPMVRKFMQEEIGEGGRHEAGKSAER